MRLPRRLRRGASPKSRAADVSGVASVVQKLGVLLAAGVPPGAAWGYLREGPVAERIARAADSGIRIPDAIVAAVADLPAEEATAWRGLATAWAVATDAGAPLASTLREFAVSLRSLAQAQREIRVALAAPAATAKMVMALPVVGVLFGMTLGFNTLATLTTTPIGIGCLAAGAALMYAASRWNRRLVAAAQPTDLTPGLEYDLTAIAVSGGGSLDRARASVETAITSYRVRAQYPASEIPADPHTRAGVDAVLDLSRRAGVPAADLLRSEAEEHRRIARSQIQERASSLAVKLMLPLGLCVLPAFMVVGVLPLLVTVISSTLIRL